MDCTEIQKHLSDYSVGLITGLREIAFERHLAKCPVCKAELDKLEGVMALVAGVEEIEPPVGLWNGVYNRITAEPERVERHGVLDRLRSVFSLRVAQVSAAAVTAALAGMLFFSGMHHTPQHAVSPSPMSSDYVQGHMSFASQDYFADEAAIDSMAALNDREKSNIN